MILTIRKTPEGVLVLFSAELDSEPYNCSWFQQRGRARLPGKARSLQLQCRGIFHHQHPKEAGQKAQDVHQQGHGKEDQRRAPGGGPGGVLDRQFRGVSFPRQCARSSGAWAFGCVFVLELGKHPAAEGGSVLRYLPG